MVELKEIELINIGVPFDNREVFELESRGSDFLLVVWTFLSTWVVRRGDKGQWEGTLVPDDE